MDDKDTNLCRTSFEKISRSAAVRGRHIIDRHGLKGGFLFIEISMKFVFACVVEIISHQLTAEISKRSCEILRENIFTRSFMISRLELLYEELQPCISTIRKFFIILYSPKENKKQKQTKRS